MHNKKYNCQFKRDSLNKIKEISDTNTNINKKTKKNINLKKNTKKYFFQKNRKEKFKRCWACQARPAHLAHFVRACIAEPFFLSIWGG
jgi:hypothetical protein